MFEKYLFFPKVLQEVFICIHSVNPFQRSDWWKALTGIYFSFLTFGALKAQHSKCFYCVGFYNGLNISRVPKCSRLRTLQCRWNVFLKMHIIKFMLHFMCFMDFSSNFMICLMVIFFRILFYVTSYNRSLG